jgi:membrane-anchored protein YejM (alkaline phosphatase superfamily)
MNKGRKEVRVGVLFGVFTAAAALVASAAPMLAFVGSWSASEAGSLYDLVLTGLTTMIGLVFTIGLVVLFYVAFRLWNASKD